MFSGSAGYLLHHLSTVALHVDQDGAEHEVFDHSKRAHVTPLDIDLHWLPVQPKSISAHVQCDYWVYSIIQPVLDTVFLQTLSSAMYLDLYCAFLVPLTSTH